jgi:hypothetical protein
MLKADAQLDKQIKKLMRCAELQGYNGQAAIDCVRQLIVAMGVRDLPADVEHRVPPPSWAGSQLGGLAFPWDVYAPMPAKLARRKLLLMWTV